MRAKHLARHVSAKRGTQALLAGALHEHDENQKDADDDFDDRQKGDQDGHKGRRIWSLQPVWQAVLCLFPGQHPDTLDRKVLFGQLRVPLPDRIRQPPSPLIRR